MNGYAAGHHDYVDPHVRLRRARKLSWRTPGLRIWIISSPWPRTGRLGPLRLPWPLQRQRPVPLPLLWAQAPHHGVLPLPPRRPASAPLRPVRGMRGSTGDGSTSAPSSAALQGRVLALVDFACGLPPFITECVGRVRPPPPRTPFFPAPYMTFHFPPPSPPLPPPPAHTPHSIPSAPTSSTRASLCGLMICSNSSTPRRWAQGKQPQSWMLRTQPGQALQSLAEGLVGDPAHSIHTMVPGEPEELLMSLRSLPVHYGQLVRGCGLDADELKCGAAGA